MLGEYYIKVNDDVYLSSTTILGIIPDSIDDMIAVGDIIFAEGRFFVNAAICVGMYLNDSFLVKGDKVISTYFDNDIPVNNEIPFEEFFKSMDSCEDAKVKTI